ncbi:Hsp20/alpha crystallin family protein [Patescibacteria group bacterium]|nr:Hsp20/alpha crystallin family protein [Patescibacteria group bacterium]
MSKNPTPDEEVVVDPAEWMEELEGQLAVDVYQTPGEIIIKAPIAGVRQEDLDVTITDEQVAIRGERHDQQTENIESYLVQECYWGSFSRVYSLPLAVDSDKATARLLNGILTITIPKAAKARTKTIAVEVG